MAKPPRLRIIGEVDLPVMEASGLAARPDGETARVEVVGDRTARLAGSTYSPSTGFGDWDIVDLSAFASWGLPADDNRQEEDSQLEAVAFADGSLIAVMQEDPPIVLVGDPATGRLQARILLDAPPSSDVDWDDANSRGEGFVLLRGGRLLIAKEKSPPTLVEFAPAGQPASGVGAADLLAPGEDWQAPAGNVEFEAVAAWRLAGDARDTLRDISALAVGPEGSLWLLSDQSRRLARLALDVPLDPTAARRLREFDDVWRLPRGARKPEGLAWVGGGHLLIALDRKRPERNGLVVTLP